MVHKGEQGKKPKYITYKFISKTLADVYIFSKNAAGALAALFGSAAL